MERVPNRPPGPTPSTFATSKITLTEVPQSGPGLRAAPRFASSSNLAATARIPVLDWFGGVSELLDELWRRIRLEFTIELPMLRKKWRIMAFGIVMQYMHGVATQLAHRRHIPGPPLQDFGFKMTDPIRLTDREFWVSEVIFWLLFASFVVWSFSPFFVQSKRFYTVLLWSRILMVLVVCQALRILSFSATSLPGPAPHCQPGVANATKAWPRHWWGHLVVDVQRQAARSCGDLIFSSHTTFALVGVLSYQVYGTIRPVKITAWVLMALLSVMIIASHKHYSVDVVVAWYTVPLVFYFMHSRWTTKRPLSEGGVVTDEVDLEEGTSAAAQEAMPLLPVKAAPGMASVDSASAVQIITWHQPDPPPHGASGSTGGWAVADAHRNSQNRDQSI